MGEWPPLQFPRAKSRLLRRLCLSLMLPDEASIRAWKEEAGHLVAQRLDKERWSMFWPCHAVHHSDTEMTWLTLERFHPFNRLITTVVDSTFLLAPTSWCATTMGTSSMPIFPGRTGGSARSSFLPPCIAGTTRATQPTPILISQLCSPCSTAHSGHCRCQVPARCRWALGRIWAAA
jgi:hypothetical protein